MKPQDLSKDIKVRTGIRGAFQALLLVSITTNLVLAFGLVTADKTHRETLIPPEISRSFWVEDKQASASYLEEMGLFIIRNALDVTPLSAEYQAKVILKYANPQSYGVLEKELMANARRMKETNVSTFFAINGVITRIADSSVAYSGYLSTILGDKTVSETPKTYLVRFGMSNGRIFVRELRETTTRNPLESEAAEQK